MPAASRDRSSSVTANRYSFSLIEAEVRNDHALSRSTSRYRHFDEVQHLGAIFWIERNTDAASDGEFDAIQIEWRAEIS